MVIGEPMNELRGIWHGKRVDSGEWAEGFLSKSRNVEEKPALLKFCIDYEENGVMMSCIVDPSTLGKCIGRCDKKGKPIFEGDIVKTKYGRLCLVEWRKTPQFIGFDLTPLEIKHKAPSKYDLFDCLEIIGNIHDAPELLENSKATRVYVIDTETTGLSPDEDEILQLSIVDESNCTVYNSLFRPERHTSWEESEKINHITPEMTANAPTFKEMLPMINEIFSFCGTVIGYNTGFDLAFLQKAGVEFREDIKVIDVQAMFTPIAGEWDWQQNKYKWQSLVKCAEYCGYEWRGSAHDSLADALATLYCYNSLVEKNGMIVRKV